MKTHLLVLDLDETLVHRSLSSLGYRESMVVGEWLIYFRPFCRSFLRDCQRRFDIGVWTASSSSYAIPIVAELFRGMVPPRFIFTAIDCHHNENQITKPLERVETLGYSLSRTIIVDDHPEVYQHHPRNGVPILPYLGSFIDSELLHLQPYLESLTLLSNIREVNKEHWRHPQEYTDRFLGGIQSHSILFSDHQEGSLESVATEDTQSTEELAF